MKPITSAITAILDDLQSRLPALLDKHEAPQFESYSIGYPLEREKKIQLCARNSEGSSGIDSDTMTFNIHAHLPGVLEVDSYRYIDAVNEYLLDFDPQIAGYASGSYSFTMTDNFRTTTIAVFWDVTLTRPKDDCDI